MIYTHMQKYITQMDQTVIVKLSHFKSNIRKQKLFCLEIIFTALVDLLTAKCFMKLKFPSENVSSFKPEVL